MANLGNHIGRAAFASYGNSRVMLLPVDAGFGDGIYRHQGADVEPAGRNVAPDGVGKVLTEIGNVVFNGAFVTCTPITDYFQTDHDEVATYTLLQVMRTSEDLTVAANQPISFGNFNGSSGSSLFIANHSTLPAPAGRLRGNFYTTANNLPTVNLADVTAWFCAALRVSAAAGKVDDLTHGFSGSVTPTGSRVLAARKHRVGGSYSPSILGTHDLAFTLYLPNRYLTDAQLAAVYARVKAYLAQPSINVVC